MSMFPAFIIGFFVGIWATAMYHAYKKATPSDVKISTLEHYIESLKDDVTLLEKENEALRAELRESKK